MVVFEDVKLEVFELLVAEWAAMVSCHWLLYAMFAVDVSAAGDIAVVDWVEADCTLKFVLEFLCVYSKIVVV
mgnify:CR=1 FL=1